ncbi:hypothetical protein [Massilia genomosp. 1]|uniref:Uncharacterized protein n=1 Tax=Massilia genomosp. 1 TaxID=2609280 RepID=A0ABX0MKR9_9BURK|nr:hypothetical protein [Massilia genomosp. 1]NHZ63361.1 hypothetical protein [Massilia genomosp. 1]
MNPGVTLLHKGDVVKFQKASVQKVITGWRKITAAAAALGYNAPRYTQVLRAVPTVLKTCLHSMT